MTAADDVEDASRADSDSNSDASVGQEGAASSERPVLLFDGVCNLCNGYVQWVIEHDPEGELLLGALQAEPGQQLLERHGLPTEKFESVVLIEDGEVYTKSTAVLRVLRRLGLPYSLSYGAVVVPKVLRDWAYDVVARRRYDWFGREEACMMPTPDIEERFLESSTPE